MGGVSQSTTNNNNDNNNNNSSNWNNLPPNVKLITLIQQENNDHNNNNDNSNSISKNITIKQSDLKCKHVNVSSVISDNIESNNKQFVIRSRNVKWFIYLPLQLDKNNTKWVKLLADTGANAACVRTEYAVKHLMKFIKHANKSDTLKTPGGLIHPKYVLYLLFIGANGITYKKKFYLVDDLPVDILADLNMLLDFGYKFKDEIPQPFRHEAAQDIDYDLDIDTTANRSSPNNASSSNTDQQTETTTITNEFVQFRTRKLNEQTRNHHVSLIQRSGVNNTIVCDNTKHDSNNKNNSELNYINKFIEENDDTKEEEENKQNKNVNLCSNYTSFMADDDEIEEARKTYYNPQLTLNDLSYLKQLEKTNKKYENLYDETMKCINKWYDKVFAKYTYDRRTYNVEARHLGIKKQHRHKTFYRAQYPLNKEKRASIMQYTEFNEKNGFWHPIDNSNHNLPYIMIPKKPDKNGIIRYRPAFDSRILNQHCESYTTNTPGPQDFNEFYSIDGLMTHFDFKNAFDGIPLHKDDWEYVVSITPFGPRQAKHFTYGHKNSSAVCQDIMNELAHRIGNTLIYVDDGCMKHNTSHGTKQLVEKLEKLFSDVVIMTNVAVLEIGYLNKQVELNSN